jgi:hypothetical protein
VRLGVVCALLLAQHLGHLWWLVRPEAPPGGAPPPWLDALLVPALAAAWAAWWWGGMRRHGAAEAPRPGTRPPAAPEDGGAFSPARRGPARASGR